ncbi:PIH1 domain-containing protein 1 isoform X1 [Zootermopsis nevadensis]|uniref:PIH1 domain-containing protein 1 isoform X1 n=2 Tax=Zootermopsis nevadensis TaxID=136037 RepID=UPI000B8E8A62|nr:PIH1 domain-containing protein 1 isoform X1 [Zootermopsis nevadensis]
MSRKKNSVLLEVDRSIIENNLLIEENQNEDLRDLFPTRTSQQTEDVPWKLVKPTPGICVKTHTEDGDKVFINICQTPELPGPDDISEETLVKIWSSDDHSSFRVPMSIGEAHEEADKAGNPTVAYDVAINPEFYKKTENSKLFLTFLLTVVMEGLMDKYGLHLATEDYVILKNRKVMGCLLPHRVRQTGSRKPAGPLIQEMTPPVHTSSRQPRYRIRREPPRSEPPEYLVAEFFMKDVTNSRDVTLDVGEDRIVLDSPGRVGQQGYQLDAFIPYSVDQDKCSASFNTDTKILTLKMAVISES